MLLFPELKPDHFCKMHLLQKLVSSFFNFQFMIHVIVDTTRDGHKMGTVTLLYHFKAPY